MPTLIVLATISTLLSIQAQTQEKYWENVDECLQQFPAARAHLLNIIYYGQYPEENDAKCYVRCMMQKNGYVDEEGNVVTDIERLPFPRFERIVTIFKSCSDINVTKCDYAYDLLKCVRQYIRM